ncbi:sporulation membrane protein YtaF [Thalassobacillus pellis]|uniref:sporulation membrane protein YtaF n=1 Tax=Thalassobacillus pellis TaxID=748008 RepID=UPI00195FADE4|nr:sporulation membrane protein YtaF [Thalassobacillus pellis]MBM7554995.1 putative sporulation protein YtaF [Thalassobacillus pellis]
MGTFITLFLLVIAVSMDSLGLGIVYGLKKIRLSGMPLLLIACLSSTIFYIALMAGRIVGTFIDENTAEIIGAMILILLGVWFLWQSLRPVRLNMEEGSRRPSWSTPSDILKDPVRADLDKSGSIKGVEAVMLALALSFDTIGAGISAAFMGLPSIVTALSIGFMTSFLLYSGWKLGDRLGQSGWFDKAGVLPGVILLLIGLIKIV